ncbi:MAG: flagellar assembly protein FliW [bacterium]
MTPSVRNTPKAPNAPWKIQSRIFGLLEITEDQQVTLPEGLVGFPACHTFALLPAGQPGFSWLQSLEEETLAFLLVDPFVYFPEFSIDVPSPMLSKLETTEAAHVSVQAVVTLGGADSGATANLQGPVLLNVQKRCGYQYVSEHAEWGTRAPIVTDRVKASSASVATL